MHTSYKLLHETSNLCWDLVPLECQEARFITTVFSSAKVKSSSGSRANQHGIACGTLQAQLDRLAQYKGLDLLLCGEVSFLSS
jgi:hypothetical protein